MKTLDYILLTLVIIGAINWGLIGYMRSAIMVGSVPSHNLGQGNYYSSLLAEITMLWLQNA